MVNGIFYPDEKDSLRSLLASWGLKEDSGSPGRAILVPHGAWDLTGTIAGTAFAALQKNPARDRKVRRVFLLGPCHGYDDEGIYLSESMSFQTPLGPLPVDMRLNLEFASCSTLIKVNDIPHLSEHSLEVILPLVKYCFPMAKIIPIIVKGERAALISGLARALRIIMEKYTEESLIVISSNISQNTDPDLALSMAEEFSFLLSGNDTEAFLAGLAEGRISPCGGALAGALLGSGLFAGKGFSALGPLKSGREEGETIYYGAFAAG